MTKRQANTIIAGIMAIILTQILCTAVLLRGQERARMQVDAAGLSIATVSEAQQEATPLMPAAECVTPVPTQAPVEVIVTDGLSTYRTQDDGKATEIREGTSTTTSR